ncbi:hypothetical protein DRJ17_05655 [Candidatus Woesearchaeota archaeon]|nr:MAG: hypothetical protein DRJ17_05655 [Candidatus Woesearchaeota archaeon]
MFIDKFEYAIKSLMHAHIRTFLTVLGVVVGVAALVTLLSVAFSLDRSINKELSKFGANNVIINPGSVGTELAPMGYAPTVGKLFDYDVEKLKMVAGVEEATGVIRIRNAIIEYKSEIIRSQVRGMDPTIFKTYYLNIKILKGRFLQNNDRKNAVIGYTVAKDLFEKDMDVGSSIKINDERFTVVGILKKEGGLMSNDNLIFITDEDARSLATDLLRNEVSAIYVRIEEGYDLSKVKEDIERQLRYSHGVLKGKEDFTVMTAETIKEQIQTILRYLTLFLGSVAAISLIVGSIGITNTMFMSVTERTDEIGILKSLGVRKKDILHIFLIESGAIGFLGGLAGIVLSVGLLIVASGFVPMELSLTWELVIMGLLFSFGLGLLSGYLPSKRAADMDVLEALRRK